jgi:hypothetical protein
MFVDVVSELVCPECMECMVPPLELCNNGQNICSECKRRHHHCPICGANITIIRIVILDSIARRQKYPCAKRDNGCPDLLSIELIAEHQAVCTHRPILCPLSKTIFKCSWKGVISDLEQHAKATHSAQIIKGATFLSAYYRVRWPLYSVSTKYSCTTKRLDMAGVTVLFS